MGYVQSVTSDPVYRIVTWPKGHWKKIYKLDWPFNHFDTYDEDKDIEYNNQWYPKFIHYEQYLKSKPLMVLAFLVRILFQGYIMLVVWSLKLCFVIYGIFPIIRFFL